MISLGFLLRGTSVLAALVATNALTWLTLGDLRRPRRTLLPDLIAAGAAWLLQAALAWLLLATLAVLVEAVGAGAPRCAHRLGCPPGLRRAILAACGVGILAVSAPATADDAAHAPPAPAPAVDLTGLALPDRLATAPGRPSPPADVLPAAAPRRATDRPTTDRPTTDRPTTDRPATDRPDAVTVRAGDSLWSIAAARLDDGASDRRIAREVRRWARANATTVTDPDLITPGQRLSVPTSEES